MALELDMVVHYRKYLRQKENLEMLQNKDSDYYKECAKYCRLLEEVSEVYRRYDD